MDIEMVIIFDSELIGVETAVVFLTCNESAVGLVENKN